MKFLLKALPRISPVYVLIFLAVLIVMLWHVYGTTSWKMDDAYISYRYASNWATGLGPVFNEGEKVEGYSNFLHVALLTLMAKVGFDIEASSNFLCRTSLILLLILMFRFIYLKIRIYRPFFCFGAGMTLAFSSPLVIWANGGLESIPVTMLLFFAVTEYLLFIDGKSNKWLHPILFGLVAISRPEGFAYFVPVFVFESLRTFYLVPSKKAALRQILLHTAPFVAIFAPYLLFRFSYYGYLMPNTVAAKDGYQHMLSGMPTLDAIKDFFSNNGTKKIAHFYDTLFGLWILPLLLAPFISRTKWYPQLVMLGVISVTFTVCIWNLGGWMKHFRLLLPVIPIIIIMFSQGLELILLWAIKNIIPLTVLQKSEKSTEKEGVNLANLLTVKTLYHGVLIVSILVVFGNTSYSAFYQRDFDVNKGKYYPQWTVFAKKLDSLSQPSDLLATWFIGCIPYHAKKLRTLDVLGLTDATIARKGKRSKSRYHMMFGKTDWKYVNSQKPTMYLSKTGGELRGFKRISGFSENTVEIKRKGRRQDNLRLFLKKDHPKLQEYLKVFNATAEPMNRKNK